MNGNLVICPALFTCGPNLPKIHTYFPLSTKLSCIFLHFIWYYFLIFGATLILLYTEILVYFFIMTVLLVFMTTGSPEFLTAVLKKGHLKKKSSDSLSEKADLLLCMKCVYMVTRSLQLQHRICLQLDLHERNDV